jgi:hypothetical protein
VGRRQLIVISATAALSILASDLAFGQGRKNHKSFRGGGGHGRQHHNQFRGGGHERLRQLSPEERQIFKRNAERWLQMDPQQRQVLREREKVRRLRMKQEADTAMRELNLRLDQQARDQFEARYSQERRRIERALRQEAEAKRQQQLPQLRERLKSEFQPHQASPGANGSPRR